MVKYKKGGLVLLIKGCSNWLALKKKIWRCGIEFQCQALA